MPLNLSTVRVVKSKRMDQKQNQIKQPRKVKKNEITSKQTKKRKTIIYFAEIGE